MAERGAAEAEEHRVDSYRRVRMATPARTRRVDREADDTLPVEVNRRENRPVRWRSSRAEREAADGRDAAKDRQTAQSAGRTG
jgi:hypothetical protein